MNAAVSAWRCNRSSMRRMMALERTDQVANSTQLPQAPTSELWRIRARTRCTTWRARLASSTSAAHLWCHHRQADRQTGHHPARVSVHPAVHSGRGSPPQRLCVCVCVCSTAASLQRLLRAQDGTSRASHHRHAHLANANAAQACCMRCSTLATVERARRAQRADSSQPPQAAASADCRNRASTRSATRR
jgi:hypothetical protein